MAYFRDFFGKGKSREFIVRVSSLGELYVQNESGDFVVCDGSERELQSSLNDVFEKAGLQLVAVPCLEPDVFNCKDWQEVVARLNSPSSNFAKRLWRSISYYLTRRAPITERNDCFCIDEYRFRG